MAKVFVHPSPPSPRPGNVATPRWGSKEAPILIATPTPTPSSSARSLSRAAQRKNARKAVKGENYRPNISTRIDRDSGCIRKLIPQPRRNDAAPNASQHSRPAIQGGRKVRRLDYPEIPANSIMPFEIEHSLFTAVQRLAEQALFFWTREWISIVLAQQHWAVPEQGELNWWIRALEPFSDDVSRALQDSNARISWLDLKSSIQALHPLRHSAVHRISRPLQVIIYWVSTAARLCSSLNDALRLTKLRAIGAALPVLDLIELEAVIGRPIEEFANTLQVARTLEWGDHRSQSFSSVQNDNQPEAQKDNNPARRRTFGEDIHNRQDGGALGHQLRDLIPRGIHAAGRNTGSPLEAGPPDLFSFIHSDPKGHSSGFSRKHDRLRTLRQSHLAKRAKRNHIDMTEDSEDEVPAIVAPHRSMEEDVTGRGALARGRAHPSPVSKEVIDLTESGDGDDREDLHYEEDGEDEARLHFSTPQTFVGLLNSGERTDAISE
ncbi:unnamed protein product [Diplocarpon coronariae]|uniref:Uncharacterized protein n=1 Tax=Diplocarpon coronariae TaxID=2795749 RepID=A0A218YWM5_9HELO|nr:hypothetical protein B2J93_8629 [Marssonina coronariae]